MNISKISITRGHRKWCEDFLREQNKSTKMVRDFVAKSRVYNPFSDKTVTNMLKRYEKSFWG